MKRFVLPFVLLIAGCGFFQEIWEPSDVTAVLRKPQVTILSPTNRQSIEYRYNLTASVHSYAAELDDVFCRVNNEGWRKMGFNGTNWTTVVVVSNASLNFQTFSVYAVDLRGNVSDTNSVTVFRLPVLLETIDVPDGQIMIAFNFSHTFEPSRWGVIPFLYGDLSNYIDGANNFEFCYLSGINQYGEGPQVLKRDPVTGYYYILLSIPDNQAYNIPNMVRNYNPADWGNINNYTAWSYFGEQLFEGQYMTLAVTNKKIASLYIPRGPTTGLYTYSGTGISISSYRKRILIDVGAHLGWSVRLIGGTESTMNLKLIWTNVRAVIRNIPEAFSNYVVGSVTNWVYYPITNYWYPYEHLSICTNGTVTNTNAYMVVTGNREFLSVSNNTWYPPTGTRLTLDPVHSNAFVIISNIPPGSVREVMYKSVCELGWAFGSQAGNTFVPLPVNADPPDYTVSNVINFY